LKLKITLRWICKKRKKTINALVMLRLTKMTKRMAMGEGGAKRGSIMTKEDVLCFDNYKFLLYKQKRRSQSLQVG
jgi:hypothetical protein